MGFLMGKSKPQSTAFFLGRLTGIFDRIRTFMNTKARSPETFAVAR